MEDQFLRPNTDDRNYKEKMKRKIMWRKLTIKSYKKVSQHAERPDEKGGRSAENNERAVTPTSLRCCSTPEMKDSGSLEMGEHQLMEWKPDAGLSQTA